MTDHIIFVTKKDVLTVWEAAYYLNVSTKNSIWSYIQKGA